MHTVQWWKGPPYYVPGTNSARHSQEKLDLWVNAEASRQRRYALRIVKKECDMYTKAWAEAPLHDGLPPAKNLSIAELREVIADIDKDSPHDLYARPLQQSDGIALWDNSQANWRMSPGRSYA
jgi:hypothetical protein